MDGDSSIETTESKTQILDKPSPELGAKKGFLSRYFGRKAAPTQNVAEEEIKIPPLSIDIFFSPHRKAEDFKGLRERVLESDIYIPELVGWEEKDKVLYNQVAKGERKPIEVVEEGESRESFLAVFQAIYNTKKPITFVDLPQKDDLIEKIEKVFDYSGVFFKDFDINLQQTKQVIIAQSQLQKRREDYIASQITSRIRELIKANPELQNKKDLKILLNLGEAHSSLFLKLRQQGWDATRSFPDSPNNTFSFLVEACRRHLFNRPLDNELLSRVFLENLFVNRGAYKKDIFNTTKKTISLSRRIFSQFNMEDAKEISDRALRNGEDLNKVFEEMFARKGINFPQSEQELDEFLQKKPLPTAA